MNRLRALAWSCSCALMIGGCATRPEEKVVVQKVATFRPVEDETLAPERRRPEWEKTGRTVTVTTIPVSAPVFNLAYGGGGVWVIGRKFTKIDPDSNSVAARFPEASACAVGVGDGSIWAIKYGWISHDLRRLDPATGEVVARVPVPGVNHGIPYFKGGPTLGEGSVWFHAGGKVLRIDPKTNRVLAAIATGGYVGIIAFGEGAVWVLAKAHLWPTSEGLLSRVDPSNNRLVETVHLGHGTFSIAVGEGAVWVAQDPAGSENNLTGGKLLRIDPNSLRIVRAIPLFHTPTAIALAADSVWIGTSGAILRVDPGINQVVESVRVPSGCGLVFGAGALWSGAWAGYVHRIDIQDFAAGKTPTAPE